MRVTNICGKFQFSQLHWSCSPEQTDPRRWPEICQHHVNLQKQTFFLFSQIFWFVRVCTECLSVLSIFNVKHLELTHNRMFFMKEIAFFSHLSRWEKNIKACLNHKWMHLLSLQCFFYFLFFFLPVMIELRRINRKTQGCLRLLQEKHILVN